MKTTLTAVLALASPVVDCALHPSASLRTYTPTIGNNAVNSATGAGATGAPFRRYRGLAVRGGSSVMGPPPVTPPNAYAKVVALGEGFAAQTWQETAVLGVLSGCHISIGAYIALSVGACLPGIAAANPGLQRMLLGIFGLPMGLLMTLVAGGSLFTGNTCVVTTAVLEGKATWSQLASNWAISFTTNLIGSLLLAFMATQTGSLKATLAGPIAIAVAKTSQPFMQLFVKGVLCNWMVCMAIWQATSAADIGSKAIAVFLPISGFVALGLEHSVANMFMIPFGMLNGAEVTAKQFLVGNILPVTLGNIVGGSVCVASVYHYVFGTKAQA